MVSIVCKSCGRVDDHRTVEQMLNYYPDGDYVITIEPKQQWLKKQKRSNDQNALMWAWINDALPFVNMSIMNSGSVWFDGATNKDGLHAFLCHKIAEDMRTAEGKVWMPDIRTSKLSRAKMSEFLQLAQAVVAEEFGCNIPLPGDEDYEMFKKQVDGEYY